jgi:acyl carrier protein
MKNNDLLSEIKRIITNTVGSKVVPDPLTNDYPLLGNLLDSLAITNLIVGLEEHFGFVFNDTELSAEAFENLLTLAELVSSKLEI